MISDVLGLLANIGAGFLGAAVFEAVRWRRQGRRFARPWAGGLRFGQRRRGTLTGTRSAITGQARALTSTPTRATEAVEGMPPWASLVDFNGVTVEMGAGAPVRSTTPGADDRIVSTYEADEGDEGLEPTEPYDPAGETVALTPTAPPPPSTVIELSRHESGDRHIESDVTVRLALRDGVHHASAVGQARARLGDLPLFPSTLPVTEAASYLVLEDGDRREVVDLSRYVELAPMAGGQLEVHGGAQVLHARRGVRRGDVLVLAAATSSTYVAVAVEIASIHDRAGEIEQAAESLHDRLLGLPAATTPVDHGCSAARAAEIYARTHLRSPASSVVGQAGEDGSLAVAWIGDVEVEVAHDVEPHHGDAGLSWVAVDGPARVVIAGLADLAWTFRPSPAHERSPLRSPSR